ncbi:MAG: M28 family metallopeptidase [Chloroflexia bacterium]
MIQIGSLFQQKHPEVPIVLNKGRYLVVDLDPTLAHELLAEEEGCYTIRPLQWGEVVFATPSLRAARSARSTRIAWVQELVGRLSRSNLEANLARLVSFPTRHSTSTHYSKAASWAKAQLVAMAYNTRTQSVSVGAGKSRNVIAEKRGNGVGTRNLILVVAHLDSININGGASAPAPGADDNGSGSVGLLEIARAMKDHTNVHDLRFVLFGGEEQGLFGSKKYVASLTASERARIRAVVNMDMIATVNTSSPSILLEGASLSQAVIDGLAEAAATYTQLTVQTSLNPFNSDHVPFIESGVPAVLIIEGTDSANHNVHTSGDVLSHINYDLMLGILRTATAFVATSVGR